MTKKEEILINVARIIHEEGLQKLTIDRVAKRSNLTKGGVLYHFDSKENLVLQMNEMVITQYEKRVSHIKSQLVGPYQFTRAYAMATVEMLTETEDLLLPAVFISSKEYDKSEQLWIQVSEKWGALFKEDEGDPLKILELRMICDGVWFSMMYQYGEKLKNEMKVVIQQYCNHLESEAV